MYIFDSDLKSVEAASFWRLNFGHEVESNIFVDDTIAGGKEGEYVQQEVSFIVGHLIPMVDIIAKIELFCGPEAGLCLLVHVPHVLMLYGKDDKSVFSGLQQWFNKIV